MRMPARPQQVATQAAKASVKKPIFARPTIEANKASRQHAPRTSHSEVLMRKLTTRPSGRPLQRRKRRSSLKAKLLTGMAVALFLFGVGVGINGLHTNNKVAAQVEHLQNATQESSGTGTGNNSVPAEGTPPSVDSYHVAAGLAQIISIPKLGVRARVLQVGVNAKDELGTPNNIFDTAWYTGSAKPGQAGATLIDGHVSGPTRHGVFYGLKTLQAGDKIQITKGDGTVLSYSVVTSKTYDADNVDMAAALVPITAGKSGLNLISCTGKVNSQGNGFLSRIVVFAQLD